MEAHLPSPVKKVCCEPPRRDRSPRRNGHCGWGDGGSFALPREKCLLRTPSGTVTMRAMSGNTVEMCVCVCVCACAERGGGVAEEVEEWRSNGVENA